MVKIKKLLNDYKPQVLAIAIILTGIIFFLLREYPAPIFQFIETIESKTKDARFKLRGPVASGNNVVIGAIDEKSLNNEGKWPWPRAKIASLIEKASDAGARVIAFDVGFFEEGDRRIINTLNQIKSDIKLDQDETAYIDSLIKRSDNDTLLAETIKKADAKIVLGFFFNFDIETKKYQTAAEIEMHEDNLFNSQLTSVRSVSDKAELNAPFLTAVSPQTNIKKISDSAEKSGFINMVPDNDGIVRFMPVIIRYDNLFYTPLSLQAISAWTDSPVNVEINELSNIDKIKIGPYDVPADGKGNIWINFRGGANVFPHIPVTDILNNQADKSLLKDKILIIGATAQGMFDLRATPFATALPGCEIHAHIIDSVLSKNLLYHLPMNDFLNILIIIITGLILGFILPATGAVAGISTYTALTFTYCLLCQLLFSRYGLMLNMFYPVAVLTLIYTSITVFRYLSESKKKKFISAAFSTYLAPSVVKQLIKSPEKLLLGGEDRDITAFFSDVQGFTSISEKLTPKELVELLNEFLTEMTDIILKYEGTVDKFEGDAIIAFFGAPNDLENHARVTCLACIEMQKKLAEMNEFWVMEGKPELFMRIGLCSGTAVVGNMGSRNRMDYTMMGDVVNTAARLEGVNKYYSSYTMISETTKHLAGPEIATREIDTIYLVGKNDPVTIYEITPPVEDMDENKKLSLQYYAKGLVLYKKKKWLEAIKYFNKAASIISGDGPSITMAKRCKALIAKPPAENWNCVFRITSK